LEDWIDRTDEPPMEWFEDDPAIPHDEIVFEYRALIAFRSWEDAKRAAAGLPALPDRRPTWRT
jgi:hypothetical protein